MNRLLLLLFFFIPFILVAQKKPLDHTVYDGWQSIGERMISNDGKWVVYTVTPQEGDADLFIQSTEGTNYKKQIPRGYNASITEDSRYVVFKIKPFYEATREARIKKKRPDEFPKDSFAVVELGKDEVYKVAKVKTYKTPEKAAGWLAYHKEAEPAITKGSTAPTQKTVDSLRKTIDSLILLVKEISNVKGGTGDNLDADEDPAVPGSASDGTDLVLRNLNNGNEKTFKNVSEYHFNAFGQKLLMKITKPAKNPYYKNAVVIYDLSNQKLDTILNGGNDFKNFAFTEDGSKAAFVAERDTAKKALQRFYDLYVYNSGKDSATVLLDKNSVGMQVGMTVSENGNVSFSKTGRRLLFGTAPILPPKDTTLVEIDLVKLDIWHYNDDYLQTQQLSRLNNELKRSYLSVYHFDENKMEQIGTEELQTVYPTNEGDGNIFYAATDTGRRVESQWSGGTKKDIYAIDVRTGEKILIKKNLQGNVYPSSTGKYLLLYDAVSKNYFIWDGKALKNATTKIKVPLYNEEHDTPSDPNPYGVMGWHKNDEYVYVYDRYDMWRIDPTGKEAPKNLLATNSGRKNKVTYRYIRTDPEQRFLTEGEPYVIRAFNNSNKQSGLGFIILDQPAIKFNAQLDKVDYGMPTKAKNALAFIYSKETYEFNNLYYSKSLKVNEDVKLTSLNPQQSQYNWGTSELYNWKTISGKMATGILYKPENFDSTKKYPMLIYFYERVSDNLYGYIAPSPTPSRLNIPFYVSRGYLVFTPDIHYTKGNPGKDAYNYIVSGAQALGKKKWVDEKNIGIQGQSWGGYQVAHLITRTNMFKAAWAGAPVVNMTSAYGGIRWESGNNRQFQYEKGQSRIGATLWQRPDLYIENSPLFHLTKVKTPVVIMANDADGAVPWYQGIEMFTALRRLGKQVWMLNYNGEAHNLVQRKNRKDIQIRQQQFFDWLLKGEKPATWIVEGVPAVKKGKDWGLEVVD